MYIVSTCQTPAELERVRHVAGRCRALDPAAAILLCAAAFICKPLASGSRHATAAIRTLTIYSLLVAAVHAAMISPNTASHLACISPSVASWIGCATSTRLMPRPSFWACCRAALSKRSESSDTQIRPRCSSWKMSRVWHDVQEPQSASPSMAKFAPVATTSSMKSAGAGLVKVGLAIRRTVAVGC